MDVRVFTVGPVQENCYLVRRDGAAGALLVDPRDQADDLLRAIEALGVTVEAILITHCHFDHIGAVAPIARATGAPVYCPEAEVPMLQDINAYVSFPGFGPYESYDPEETVAGGERLELAGLDVEVLSTPGHSIGHVTYVVQDGEGTPYLFSGDVLFQGSIGRWDFPGASLDTLLASITMLLERFDDDAVVHPGHMRLTTLGAERATNPFLVELAGS
jgi:glyoxylase-like metal-dependent hydrolase (beta-lactamase superfamily II)